MSILYGIALLVGMKQSQMEFMEGSITIFIEGPWRPDSKVARRVLWGLVQWTEPAFQCVTIYKKRFFKMDGEWYREDYALICLLRKVFQSLVMKEN